jgi:hypothetical protein
MDVKTKKIVDEWINKNYITIKKLNKTICNKQTSNKSYKDDILHEILIDLYNIEQKKIVKLIQTGHIIYYITNMLKYSYSSTTSKFYQKYKLPEIKNIPAIDEVVDEVAFEEKMKECYNIINTCLKWDEKKIFMIKIETGLPISRISADMGINSKFLYDRYKMARKKISKYIVSK